MRERVPRHASNQELGTKGAIWASRKGSPFLLGYALLTVFLFGLSLEAAAQTAGTFMPTGNMTTRRFLHCAALLADGRVLIAGGEMIVGTGVNIGLGLSFKTLAGAELYDPSTGTFTPTGEMVTPRSRCTLTLLPDGKVLAAGGSDGQRALASAELYDPSTGTFTATGSMLTAGGGVPTLLNDGRVLIVGADNELYDPATGTFTATGNMSSPGADTATLLPNGEVLITRGNPRRPEFLSSAELYDPATGAFASVGYMSTNHTGPTAVLLTNGNVLVAGGDIGDGDGNSRIAELFNPDTGAFDATGNMIYGREQNSATSLRDGTVLFAGGHMNNAESAELYDPVRKTFSVTGVSFMRGTFLRISAKW